MEIMYIDTHAHLDFPQLRPHLEAVLANAKMAGVDRIITIGIDSETNGAVLQIAETFEGIFASVGWHPHEAEKADVSLEKVIPEFAETDKVVAIGEIGLDFYRNYSPQDKQRDVFSRMIRIASHLDLPIIVHSRAALEETIEIIQRERSKNTRGVFHCFVGDVNALNQVLDIGFDVSFTGNITYKNTHLIPTVAAAPLDRVMLETDCPFLAPHPHRGKRNEPAYIPLIAAKLAEVNGVGINKIAAQTTQNAQRLFQL
jgi:TatD DNase family protein